ncbi:MAG: leucine-rich repeat domain-containing protein [Candidatus Hydrogenedentes bacterium]|nr:leucine-rich repeat domain-containing protein [Candidatus Hydrogenedentota bacterium]
MKHVTRGGLLMVVCAGLMFGHGGCPTADPFVFFPDEALDAAVRAAISKPLGVLNRIDLLGLRTLDARGLDIRNLEGLEYCTNLTYLDLSSNAISNITPLATLTNLTTLNLDSNSIFDISALAGLRNLQGLSLCDNAIADIQPLVTNAITGGLGTGDYVVLDIDALDEQGETVDVPFLEDMGVNVVDCSGGGEEE